MTAAALKATECMARKPADPLQLGGNTRPELAANTVFMPGLDTPHTRNINHYRLRARVYNAKRVKDGAALARAQKDLAEWLGKRV